MNLSILESKQLDILSPSNHDQKRTGNPSCICCSMTMPVHHLLSQLQEFHRCCPPSISIEFTISQRPLKKADGGSNGLGVIFLHFPVLVHPDAVNCPLYTQVGSCTYKVTTTLAKEVHGKVGSTARTSS
jgi:hypothetical protein